MRRQDLLSADGERLPEGTLADLLRSPVALDHFSRQSRAGLIALDALTRSLAGLLQARGAKDSEREAIAGALSPFRDAHAHFEVGIWQTPGNHSNSPLHAMIVSGESSSVPKALRILAQRWDVFESEVAEAWIAHLPAEAGGVQGEVARTVPEAATTLVVTRGHQVFEIDFGAMTVVLRPYAPPAAGETWAHGEARYLITQGLQAVSLSDGTLVTLDAGTLAGTTLGLDWVRA